MLYALRIEQLQERLSRGFTPAVVLPLAERLWRFRHTQSLTYRTVAERVSGIHLTTVRRAELGGRLSVRVASQLENFLARSRHAL